MGPVKVSVGTVSMDLLYEGGTGVRVSAGEVSVLYDLVTLTGCHTVTLPFAFSFLTL